ncbi:MAG: 30S ribosomal protein S27e [Nanoarchaeota archaeon]
MLFKKPSPLWKVKCKKCENVQIVYSKPSTEVKCLKCKEIIIVPTGGKGETVNCEVIEVIQ